MSGRTSVGHVRGTSSGSLQPLKATVPYQLSPISSNKPRAHRRDGKKTAGQPKQPQQQQQQLSPGMRRTMSLDAIVGPYLLGHWPKEPESHSHTVARRDKATQTPDSWSDKSQRSNTHQRSASWGSDEHLHEIAKLKQQLQQKCVVSGGQRGYPPGGCGLGTAQTQPIPIPPSTLSTLVPRLRCSLEGLNQELEGMFVCQPTHNQLRLLEVPDGHRAPVPPQSCSSGSQSDPPTIHLSSSSSSPSSSSSSSPSSPPIFISVSSPSCEDAPLEINQGVPDGPELSLLTPASPASEAQLLSSSPGPNKSCCFQREPPEGCEKVKVWEETSSPSPLKPVLVSSCPDPNKVNFRPYGGSAFCPVSLPMDLLLLSLAVSPSGTNSSSSSTTNSTSCQALSVSPVDPPNVNSNALGENSADGLAF